VTSPQRSPVMAQVPTMIEAGYPRMEAVAWHGIFAPAGTPQAVVDKLNSEIVKALEKPDISELLAKQAMEPVGSSPQQFAAFLKKDIATWKEVAAAANVSVE
jgi:tripartite-type tricarboxylate transporter receptor subunit TctC